MNLSTIDRIDEVGTAIMLSESDYENALRQGEALHRDFRPHISGDYVEYLRKMAVEGAGVFQLVHEGEVRALAIWRAFLTTYSGRRMEVDDLVTTEGHRSKGYGATLIAGLEAKARSLSCHAVMLNSGTSRVDAHRFYLRERYTIGAFQFIKRLN